MCGICGFSGFKDDALINKMNRKLIHRGPDFTSFYADDDISLGHTRLSIIDLSENANQPMFNEDEKIVLVYNGEIYNYKILRDDLKKKGHIFKSKSDTEVILHAYEEYDTHSFSLFNGMFAFALWDKTLKKLFLVRDRLGIKPLYYYYKDGKLIFGSEIKAILESSEVKRKVKSESLIEFLTYQNIMGDKTLFAGINILEPGNYLEYSHGQIDVTNYWDLEFNIDTRTSLSSNLIEFQKIFSESVSSHLMSDVPIGSYLSGGFDSTSVATLASQHLDEKIRTFTARFLDFPTGSDFDESVYARLVSDRISSIHEEIVVQPSDFIDNIEKIVYALEGSIMGPGALPQYITARHASKSVKVVLTGHGGDEFFCGYPVHKAFFVSEKLKENYWSILNLHRLLRKSEFRFFVYYGIFKYLNPQIRFGLPILFGTNEIYKLFNNEYYDSLVRIDPESEIRNILKGKDFTPIERLQYLHYKTYLPSLFVSEDKISMAHSLESRVPICSNSVLDLALSIPFDQKMTNNTLKFFIKRVMRNKLPKLLYKQPKRGFPVPISDWFKGPLKDYVTNTLLSTKSLNRGIFSEKYVNNLLFSHFNSNLDTSFELIRSQKIWTLLNIELCHRAFID